MVNGLAGQVRRRFWPLLTVRAVYGLLDTVDDFGLSVILPMICLRSARGLGMLSYAIYLLHPCLQPALPGL